MGRCGPEDLMGRVTPLQVLLGRLILPSRRTRSKAGRGSATVLTVRDVPYATEAERAEAGDQAADLCVDVRFTLEAQRAGGRPVLLYIHGGAWLKGMGDKDGYGPLSPPAPEYFAERGWVTCSMDYRLVNPKDPAAGSRWPAMIIDVKRCIRWVRDNIAQFGGAPDWVAVCGGSAGGHLALLAGMLTGPEYQPGFEGVDTRVRAVVSYYPVVDTLDGQVSRILHDDKLQKLPEGGGGTSEAERERASPLHYIARCPVPGEFPRIMVIQGARDALCPTPKCRLFVELLRQRLAYAGRSGPGGRVCYLEFPRARHAFDVIHGFRSWYSLLAANRFLAHCFENSS